MLDKLILREAARETPEPARRSRCIAQIREVLDVAKPRVCRVLGQHRSTQRQVPCGADDEQALTADIVALTKQYGRYGDGDPRATALLHAAGWPANHKRVERIIESPGNLTPADVSFGRAIAKRARIERQTTQHRRLHHPSSPPDIQTSTRPILR